MSFLFYDLSFLIIFSLIVGIFLYVKRKKLVKDGPMFLYKTKIGLEFIEYAGKKFPRTMKFLSYVSIGLGYILMIFAVYSIYLLVKIFSQPALVKAIKIPPIMPLIPYLPELFKVDWLPPFYFTYWIVALALVAIFHEGAHGIFAKFNNIKIKSTGFGFLGPFLAFFVEQDNNQMKKAKPFAQMSILSAGVFANTVLAILTLIIMILFFSAAYAPSGILVKNYVYSIGDISIINESVIFNETLKMNGYNLTRIEYQNNSYFVGSEYIPNKTQTNSSIIFFEDLPALRGNMMGKTIIEINQQKIKTIEDLGNSLKFLKPDSKINITLRNSTKGLENYEITLKKDPSNESRGIIGIASQNSNALVGTKAVIYKLINLFRDPNTDYQPKGNAELTIFIYTLFWWLFFINLSVAIVNMLPIAIFDGGQFFYLTILAITKKEKIAASAFKIMTRIFIAVFILVTIFWAIGFFR